MVPNHLMTQSPKSPNRSRLLVSYPDEEEIVKKRGEARMGSGGFCICLKCGERVPHRQGQPCMDAACPSCGATMIREGSPRHQAYLEKQEKKRSADGG